MDRDSKGRFDKGNKFSSIKKYETVEELINKMNSYFDKCDKNILTKDRAGNDIAEPYTVEGLALHLELTMQSLWNYEKIEGYEQYFEAVNLAKLRIQHQKIVRGHIGFSNPTITIFDLKNNHGYRDKQEVEQTIETIKPLQFSIIDKDFKVD